MTLIPSTARAGDTVLVAYGGLTPFVVRAVGQEYELLGPAYVHGIMDGEIVKQADHPPEKVTLI